MNATAHNAPNPAADQRSDARIKLRLDGKLFLPASEATFDCIVVDLSAGGAGLYCSEVLPLSSAVVLYVNSFGRFEGTVTRYAKGELGLHFVFQDAKRKRLEDALADFVKDGMRATTRLRRSERSTARAPIDHFTRADGSVVPCVMHDISLQGISLRAKTVPPIGEVIEVGQTRGWVVRHFDDCIGVQFLEPPRSPG